MNKTLGLLVACALLAIVSALNYDFQITLARIKNPDGDLNGTLKAYVFQRNSKKSDFLRLNETTLRQGNNYTTRVNYPYQAFDIQNVTFQWTLTSPYPPKFIFRKPGIYLQQFTIIPTYIQNPQQRAIETKRFCPKSVSQIIKHKDELPLVRC